LTAEIISCIRNAFSHTTTAFNNYVSVAGVIITSNEAVI
jgi:hypothetical protein